MKILEIYQVYFAKVSSLERVVTREYEMMQNIVEISKNIINKKRHGKVKEGYYELVSEVFLKIV